jgi:hypothetical protein
VEFTGEKGDNFVAPRDEKDWEVSLESAGSVLKICCGNAVSFIRFACQKKRILIFFLLCGSLFFFPLITVYLCVSVCVSDSNCVSVCRCVGVSV